MACAADDAMRHAVAEGRTFSFVIYASVSLACADHVGWARLSPRGPRGISFSFLCCICEPLIIRRNVQQLLPSLVQTHFDGQISELLRAFAPVLRIVKVR